jgi:hypothetical protein
VAAEAPNEDKEIANGGGNGFRKILGAKQAEVTKTRGRDGIVIERSADVLEEADYKTARELAIAGSTQRGVGIASDSRRFFWNLFALRE